MASCDDGDCTGDSPQERKKELKFLHITKTAGTSIEEASRKLVKVSSRLVSSSTSLHFSTLLFSSLLFSSLLCLPFILSLTDIPYHALIECGQSQHWGRFDLDLKRCAPSHPSFWHLPPKDYGETRNHSPLLSMYILVCIRSSDVPLTYLPRFPLFSV